jgi:tRNA C32,U32 (ribose-2'-O)-methylase TrmJ
MNRSEYAHNSREILENATVVTSLNAALDDWVFAIAFSRRSFESVVRKHCYRIDVLKFLPMQNCSGFLVRESQDFRLRR